MDSLGSYSLHVNIRQHLRLAMGVASLLRSSFDWPRLCE